MTKTSGPVLVKTNRPNRKKKKHFSAVNLLYCALYVVIIAFILYSVTALTNINLQKAEKEQLLKETQSQIKVQELKNEELDKINSYTGNALKRYQEQVAHDNGYVKKGERVFVHVSGD